MNDLTEINELHQLNQSIQDLRPGQRSPLARFFPDTTPEQMDATTRSQALRALRSLYNAHMKAKTN